MKQQKLLVIAGLLVLLPLSWYQLINDNQAKQKQYDAYLAEARYQASIGIVKTAREQYDAALDMHKSYDILSEIAKMYLDNEYYELLEDITDTMIHDYPKKIPAYEYMAEYYYRKKNITSLYRIKDALTKRSLESSLVNDYCDQFKNYFEYCDSNVLSATNFYDNYSVAQASDELYYYYDVYGRRIFSTGYELAGLFNSQGMAVVREPGKKTSIIDLKQEKLYVDTEDNAITKASRIVDERMVLEIDGKYYVSNLKFKLISDPYDYIGSFFCGMAAARNGDTWFFVDEDGKKINDQTYEDIIEREDEMALMSDRAFVKTNGSYQLINSKFEPVGSQTYEDAKLFTSGDNIAAVKINGKWAFADIDGNLLTEAIYEDARPFSNGLGAIKENGYWHFVDETFQKVISDDFLDVRQMSYGGAAFVQKDDTYDLLKLISRNH